MVSIANELQANNLTVGIRNSVTVDSEVMMGFELIIVVALIVLFIVSLCSLLQKIRKAYAQDHVRRRTTDQQIFTVPTDGPPPYDNQNDANHGVYPCAPDYTGYYDPPPKYDDVIKSDHAVLSSVVVLPTVHLPTTQSHQENTQHTTTTQ
nr:uncharacterized protein LOC111415260 [Onthophagus taurus]